MPALRWTLDPTGAGDIFGSALLIGTLAGWRLVDRLNFASLCSSLAIQQFGGSLAARAGRYRRLVGTRGRPIRARVPITSRCCGASGFLEALMPSVPPEACRRATATIARRADVPGAGLKPKRPSGRFSPVGGPGREATWASTAESATRRRT